MSARKTPMYRALHGAPILAGIPVHYLLALLGIGVLGGVGAMFASRLAGVCCVLAMLASWAFLAFVFGRDRVQVPLFLLRLRYRFPSATSSYARSYLRVVVLDRETGEG